MAENLDDLKEIQRLTSNIASLNTQIAEQSDKRNKRLEREANTMSSITSDIKTQEDLTKAIEGLERRKSNILKTNYGTNNKYKQDLLQVNQTSLDILKTERTRIQTLEKVAAASNKVGESLKGGLDSIKTGLQQIPVLGDALSKIVPTKKFNELTDSVTSGFTRGFGIMFNRGISQGKGFVKSFAGGLRGGMAGVSKAIGPLLSNPYTAAALAAAAFIAIGVLAFSKVEGAAKKFREETGLLNSQTEGLKSRITGVAQETAGLGASLDDVASAAAAFSKEFDNTQQASTAVLKSVVVLNKNFGIAVDDAVKVNEQFQRMGGLSAETAQSMLQTTVEAARLAGVAPNQVISDIAQNSEAAYKFFNGSPAALAKAAVEAAKLGTSIGEAAGVADKLLNFESSINAELNASAMLGTNINFNEARRLAASKDIIGAQKAVVKEVSKLGDLTKLSVFEQEALAEAAGMPIEDLIKQQQIQQNLGDLGDEQLAAANALIKKGMQVKDISKEQLNAEADRLAKQQELQSTFDTLGNKFKAIGTELLLAFAPIGEIIMEVFGLLAPIVSGFMKPIGNAIKGIVSAFQELKEPFNDIFGEGSGDGLKKTLEFVGKLLAGPMTFSINLISNSFKMIASFVGGIMKVLKGIFTGDLGMIGEGLGSIFEGIFRYILSIPVVLYETIVDMFPAVGEFFTSLAGKIKNFFMGILPGWAQKLLGGESISAAATEGAQLEAAGSIDDGIVQNGKIISTNPADTIVATKTPGDMLGSLISNSPLGMIGSAIGGVVDNITGGGDAALLEELKGLRADLASGKVGVYMDGKKVTSGVNKVVDNVGTNTYSLG